MIDLLSGIERGGRSPVVNWSRDTVHCLVHVEDAAAAVVAALDFPIAGYPVNVVNAPRTAEEVFGELVIFGELVMLYGGNPLACFRGTPTTPVSSMSATTDS